MKWPNTSAVRPRATHQNKLPKREEPSSAHGAAKATNSHNSQIIPPAHFCCRNKYVWKGKKQNFPHSCLTNTCAAFQTMHTSFSTVYHTYTSLRSSSKYFCWKLQKIENIFTQNIDTNEKYKSSYIHVNFFAQHLFVTVK